MQTSRLLLLLCFMLAAALLISIGPDQSSTSVLAAGSTGCPAGPLDCGPWPTLSHDNQRTNQSRYLLGPIKPADVKVIYDSGTTPLNDVVITSDGKILLATCSPEINLVDASGNINASGYQKSSPYRFPFGLSSSPYSESAVGFTVASDGTIYAAIHECPDVQGPVPVNYYSITKDGTNRAGWPIVNSSAMYDPPLVANGTIYQMDELNVVHAYATSNTQKWSVGLPGFSNGAMAMDSAGNIYVGTESSAFSLSPTGQSRTGWPQDLGGLPANNAPVVSSQDIIYIVNSAGSVYAFNQDGSSRAGFPFSTGGTISQRPLAVGASQTVYLQTSGLFAINPDGTSKWSFSPSGGGPGSLSAVLDANENVYVAFGNSVYSLDITGKLRSGWPATVPTAGLLVLGGNGILYAVGQNEKLYSISGGLLEFPLHGSLNPENAEISTVFDHDQPYPYGTSGGEVSAYTGESAGPCGPNICTDPVGTHGALGFTNHGGTRFYVNGGNYTGGGNAAQPAPCNTGTCPTVGRAFLYYLGHPGIDYPQPCGTPVYAAVSGTAHFPASLDGLKGQKFHILEIIPSNGSAYRPVYLHMSTYPGNQAPFNCVNQPSVLNEGDPVVSGQTLVGLVGHAGLPKGNHLHFEVHLGGVPVDPYGWTGNYSDPYAPNGKLTNNLRLWK